MNEQNQHLPFVRVNRAGRIVSYEYELDVSAPNFGGQVLAESCSRVAEAAARFGPLLEARFGGRGSDDGPDRHEPGAGGPPRRDYTFGAERPAQGLGASRVFHSEGSHLEPPLGLVDSTAPLFADFLKELHPQLLDSSS